jgi:hypothetical protein
MFDARTEDSPTNANQRRRVVDHPKPGRIGGLAEGDQRNTELLRRCDLALCSLARTDAGGRCRSAPSGQFGKRLEGGSGAAAMIEQGTECARTDVVAADQPQPIEPLLVG